MTCTRVYRLRCSRSQAYSSTQESASCVCMGRHTCRHMVQQARCSGWLQHGGYRSETLSRRECRCSLNSLQQTLLVRSRYGLVLHGCCLKACRWQHHMHIYVLMQSNQSRTATACRSQTEAYCNHHWYFTNLSFGEIARAIASIMAAHALHMTIRNDTNHSQVHRNWCRVC